MNNISWYIYLADVLNNLGHTLSGLMCFLGSVLGGFTVLTLLSFCNPPRKDRYGEKEGEAFYNLRYTFKKCMIISFSLLLLVIVSNIIVPSRNTLLMIAGSQITQQVVTTQQGQEVLTHLSALINKKLSDMEK